MASEHPLLQTLLQRIQQDYNEQPGLRLTPQQAQRLWGLDGPTCGEVLAVLVDAGVLQRTPDGHFMRRHSAAGERAGNFAVGGGGCNPRRNPRRRTCSTASVPLTALASRGTGGTKRKFRIAGGL